VLDRAHADEHGDRQADLLAVDDADPAFDIALFFEALDALPAGRTGQADFFAQSRDRQRGIRLQSGEDCTIKLVQ